MEEFMPAVKSFNQTAEILYFSIADCFQLFDVGFEFCRDPLSLSHYRAGKSGDIVISKDPLSFL